MFSSAALPLYIESINGLPQPVLKLNFERSTNHGFELSAQMLLERVIVGPSTHPETIARAFAQQLSNMGFTDALLRVHRSGIPLRLAG